ncbi:glycosyltransferase family 25 protein [Paracoccus sp. SSK6]|uniref:glycosyltransferase family 25 protein n=1 Tax=Paracoccus sp. SSK6 TaxID=3143131 RepID=UPI00321A25FE
MTDWPILVLTLAGDEGRRAPLVAALDSAGLSHELVEGIDARKGLPAQYEAMVDREHARQALRRPMSDGEFACALSHRAIHQMILDRNLPGAIVLEDDALLDRHFADFVRAGLYRDVPMALIYHNFARALPFVRRSVGSFAVMRRVANKATGAMAYTLRADAAARLVQAATPVRRQADWPCDLYGLGAWFLVPRLVEQRPDNDETSHLRAERSRLRDLMGSRRSERSGYASIGQWLRERVSVRVGRQRGSR